jgi:hypothetical protein
MPVNKSSAIGRLGRCPPWPIDHGNRDALDQNFATAELALGSTQHDIDMDCVERKDDQAGFGLF